MLYKPQTQSVTQASFPLTRSGLKPARPLPKGEVKKKEKFKSCEKHNLNSFLGQKIKVKGYTK